MLGSNMMLYQCGCAAPVAESSRRPVVGAIDIHCHLVTPAVGALIADRPEVAAMRAIMPKLMGQASFAHNIALEAATNTRILDPVARLADMDLIGIAIQVVSPAPTQYHYWADETLAERLVAVQNEHITSLCREHPGRFLGLGAVAMQHTHLAEKQLSHLMAAGFKGVEISTRVGERDLSDPVFERFWAIAAEAGAVIFIHPLGSTLGPRLADDYLANIVGQPAETTVALSQLIFAGVLDRHPALKLVAAHGGGYLPGFIGRSDHAHAVRPDSRRCRDRPSEYLKRIWYDTVVHAPHILANLVAVAGVSQILIGTDYPYDMGEYQLGALLDGLPSLCMDDRQAIIAGNAKRLLGIV